MLVIEISPSGRFRPLSFSSLLPICGVRAGVPTVFFGVRKCNPGSRQPFPAYPKDKKTSMGKGFSKNKIHSLCVPRYCFAPFNDLRLG